MLLLSHTQQLFASPYPWPTVIGDDDDDDDDNHHYYAMTASWLWDHHHDTWQQQLLHQNAAKSAGGPLPHPKISVCVFYASWYITPMKRNKNWHRMVHIELRLSASQLLSEMLISVFPPFDGGHWSVSQSAATSLTANKCKLKQLDSRKWRGGWRMELLIQSVSHSMASDGAMIRRAEEQQRQ